MQKKPIGEKKILISAKVHPDVIKSSKKMVSAKIAPSFSQYIEDALSIYNLMNGGGISVKK